MTAVRTLRVGTRNSALARTQTDLVVRSLQVATGEPVEVEIVPIVTEGDVSKAALAQIGGTGVFVTSLRTALLDGRIDLAIHSYKDLPTAPAAGLAIGAVPTREDPRDVLVARDRLTLGELPEGSVIGTGSPRRAAQLLALGLGLVVEPIRGNVDTRLAAVTEGRVDAVVLAAAGLRRLGRHDEVTEVLDPTQLLPAPAQGALAVEIRSDDDVVAAWVAAIEDPASRAAVLAERSVLATLEAGCSAPVGALADVALGFAGDQDDDGEPDELYLRASVTAVDGSDAVRLSATGPLTDAEDIGRRLAAELIDLGADTMMGSST